MLTVFQWNQLGKIPPCGHPQFRPFHDVVGLEVPLAIGTLGPTARHTESLRASLESVMRLDDVRGRVLDPQVFCLTCIMVPELPDTDINTLRDPDFGCSRYVACRVYDASS